MSTEEESHAWTTWPADIRPLIWELGIRGALWVSLVQGPGLRQETKQTERLPAWSVVLEGNTDGGPDPAHVPDPREAGNLTPGLARRKGDDLWPLGEPSTRGGSIPPCTCSQILQKGRFPPGNAALARGRVHVGWLHACRTRRRGHPRTWAAGRPASERKSTGGGERPWCPVHEAARSTGDPAPPSATRIF